MKKDFLYKFVAFYYRTLFSILKRITFGKKQKKRVLIGSSFPDGNSQVVSFSQLLIKQGVEVIVVNKTLGYQFKNEFNVVKYGSIPWLIELLKTNTIFVTHNVSDVSPIKLPHHKVINIGHGFTPKATGYSSKIEMEWINHKIKRGLPVEYSLWDILLCYSEFHKEILLESTGKQCGCYVNAGYAMVNLLETMELPGQTLEKKIKVLFCPTFRGSGNTSSETLSIISDIAKDLSNTHSFSVKLHPLSNCNASQVNEYLEILDNKFDIYQALEQCEIVISDYSSLIFDAMSASKVSIAFIYDIVKYESERGEMAIKYDELEGILIAKDQEELKSHILSFDYKTSSKSYLGRKYQTPLNIEKLMSVIYEEN
jgi:CDP-glycerol glycerophosphotransferase (TagB/SpsB family)